MNLIDQITTYIIRPTREKYHINRLGSKQHLVNIPGHTAFIVMREDFHATNSRNQKIVYSYYNNYATKYPDICVVYLHANNGSRVEGLHYLEPLLENKFNVCLLDSSGSGLSQGDFITLGPNQTDDLSCVFEGMRQKKGINKMILWGRSMGACTALMYASKYPHNVCSMILDSPFKDLRKLVKQIASERTKLPQFFFDPILNLVDRDLENKIGHRFDQYKMKQYIPNNEANLIYYNQRNIRSPPMPALFLASDMDRLVKCHHVEKLYTRYPGIPGSTKILHYIKNQHHQNRDRKVIQKCINFLNSSLQNLNHYPSFNNYMASTQQSTHINGYANLFDEENNVQNTKFSFKNHQVVRPQSSFSSNFPKFDPYFCFGKFPSLKDELSLESLNKSPKKPNEKINLSKNNIKNQVGQSLRSDINSSFSISLRNDTDRPPYMLNSFRQPRAKSKLEPTYYSLEKSFETPHKDINRAQNLRTTMGANLKQQMLQSVQNTPVQAKQNRRNLNDKIDFENTESICNLMNNEYTPRQNNTVNRSKSKKINLNSIQNQQYSPPTYPVYNHQHHNENINRNINTSPIQVVPPIDPINKNGLNFRNGPYLSNNVYYRQQPAVKSIHNYNQAPPKQPPLLMQSPPQLNKNKSYIAINNNLPSSMNIYRQQPSQKISLAKVGVARGYYH